MSDPIERELGASILEGAYRRDDEAASPVSHVVGFWVFLSVASVLLAAAVFLPIWREQQDVRSARRRAEQRLTELRVEVRRLHAVVEALHADPVVNQHTALRDLNYHLPGQEVVPVEPTEVVDLAEAPTRDPRVSRTNWLWAQVPEEWRHIESWAELVCQSDVKRGMLIAAAFLVSSAIVLFAPPAPRPIRLRAPEASA